jgi:uncharacterized protein (TIGR02284 family)
MKLSAFERGEDTAKHAYEAALKQDLPTDVRTIIERQYQGAKENLSNLRPETAGRYSVRTETGGG